MLKIVTCKPYYTILNNYFKNNYKLCRNELKINCIILTTGEKKKFLTHFKNSKKYKAFDKTLTI